MLDWSISSSEFNFDADGNNNISLDENPMAQLIHLENSSFHEIYPAAKNSESTDAGSSCNVEEVNYDTTSEIGSIYCPSGNDSNMSSYNSDNEAKKILPRTNYICNTNEGEQKTSSMSNSRIDYGEKSIAVAKPSGIMKIDLVEPSGKKSKKYFCKFCHKTVTKMARHLETVHKEEAEVKSFSALPKGTAERKNIIHLLKSAGSFLYNTNVSYNKGNLQVSRRPQIIKKRTPHDYVVCPHCKESYSKISLRRHAKKCLKPEFQKDRSVMVMGRRVKADIHPIASDVLRNQIYPYLRDDEVIRCIKYDEFIIRFLNEQCLKYRSEHHHKMIRAEIRLIGRFLLQLQKLEPSIKNISEAFNPKNFDRVLEAIASLGDLDVDLNIMKKPNVPLFLGTLLRKLADYHKSVSIMKEDIMSQKNADNFLCLFNTHFNPHINQTVIESKLYFSRKKRQEIPSDEDIHKLMLYILNNLKYFFDRLTVQYHYQVWLNLQSFSLLWIICFNRRRVGEVERMKIEDFKNFQRVDKFADKDIYNSLSTEGKQAAEDFIRVQLRGKLGRTVPLLLCRLVFQSISLVLKYREKAFVPERNPYVFGLPGFSRDRFIEACSLLRYHSVKCGALKPNLLRGTNLRKHIATKSVLLNLNDREVSDLANYMGHNEKIHRTHYRLPIVAREIIEISKILIRAQCAEQGIPEIEVESQEGENCNIDIFQAVDSEITEIEVESPSIVNSIKKSTTAMFLPTSRKKPCSSCEKETALRVFSRHLSSRKTPKLSECFEAIKKFPTLKSRSPQSLKTWINNQINNNVSSNTGSVRRAWSSPERAVLNEHFSLNYSMRKLPSLNECQKAMDKFLVLAERTPKSIKAKIHNDLKKRNLFNAYLQD